MSTFECASTNGRDLHLFGEYKTDKKIGIGVVNHRNTMVEPQEYVANLIRRAPEFIPPDGCWRSPPTAALAARA